MHSARAEESDAPRHVQPCNETTKLCLYEGEKENVCSVVMHSSPSHLQTLDETARALCFGLSHNIASKEWFLPWLSLMHLSTMQVSRHSTIRNSGVMALFQLQAGPNLGLMVSSRSDHTSSLSLLQGVLTDTQSSSITEKEQFTPQVEECVQDDSDCKPQCISSPVPSTTSPLQSSPVSNLQPSKAPPPPPLPPLMSAPRKLPLTLPITRFYSNKPASVTNHTPSLFHLIKPLDAFSLRAILRQGLGQKRKETTTELDQQGLNDDSCSPMRKKAKFDEPTEDDSSVQIVPTAETKVLEHDNVSQDNTDHENFLSNQVTCAIQPEMSPKNEVGSSYEQWSQDNSIPLLDSSFQSDSFHQVPGSPSDYPAEPQPVEELFPALADDVTKSKCSQGANNTLLQNLDCDNEDHTVPIELTVADLYRRSYLKKAYNNFNEPVEPARLNLTKPRLRLGLSKKQRCKPLHSAL